MSWASPPQKIYDFIWDTYCDWYIELTKARLQGEDQDRQASRPSSVLCYVLTETLKLLHPFMPFITEEIWQALPHEAGNDVKFLMLQTSGRSTGRTWPSPPRRRPWSC